MQIVVRDFATGATFLLGKAQAMSQFTLADDDEKFLFLLYHVLATSFPGSSIASFTNAEDAFVHVLTSGTQLLITDHAMGALDGTELIRELRRRDFPLPIIMVSGSPEAEAEALAAGATLFLSKDAAMKRLVDEVKRLLPAEPPVRSTFSFRCRGSLPIGA